MNYTALEPNISQPFLPMMSSVTDTVTGIATSVSFLWSMGIIICAAATGFVLMRGGLYRMEASEAGIRKSNDEFKRGTLGLLGVLSLFLIIYTVNKDLLVGDVGLSALKTTVTGDGGTTNLQTDTTNTNTQGGMGEQESRAYLSSIGISINKNACAQGQTSNCTNVAGLPKITLDMLASLRRSCSSCELVVTGGTEPGHSTHGVGKRPVDLRITSSLSSFLRQQGILKDPTHILWGGFTFWDEPAGATSNTTGDHYHVY